MNLLIDSIRTKVGNQKFATRYRGQKQIGAIWISKDSEAIKATVFSLSFSIEDHRDFNGCFRRTDFRQ